MANGIIRSFGPILGEGVRVNELAGDLVISPGLFGVTAYAGIMEKGPTDRLIEVGSQTSLARQTGGVIPGTDLPDNNQDFWATSRGAGKQFLIRITDGTGRKSEMTFFTRETDPAAPIGIGYWRQAIKVTAHSVGRWGGAYNRRIAEMPNGAGTDLAETTLDTGLTLLLNEFKGGTLTLAGVASKSYKIVSNTTAGVVTVTSDSTMSTDYGAAVDEEFTLFKSNFDEENTEKKVAILWKDGVRAPDTEFGGEVYQNGVKFLNWDDLSMDPNSDVYFVPKINDRGDNYEIVVEDLYTLSGGAVTANVRPANQFGTIPAGGLAATVLTLEVASPRYPIGNTGDGVIGTFTYGTSIQRDLLTLTVTNDAVPGSEVWSVASSKQDKVFPDATTAVAYTAENAWSLGFTITAGAAAWVNGDQIFVEINPLVPDEAIGGQVFYDVAGDPRASLEIVDNDETTVTVRPQFDLTALTAVGNYYRLQYKQGLELGYDGHDGVTDADYQAVFDPSTSLFNRLRGRNLGLVKFATPGVTSTAVQKDGRDYNEIYGGSWRYEFPHATVTTEDQAINHLNNTLGRNDLVVMTFPSFYYKQQATKAGLKLVSATGMIHGGEARFAVAAQGYHTQFLGNTAVLSLVKKIPFGNSDDHETPDREKLKPAGIQSFQKKGPNWIHYGNTVPNENPGSSRWKNKREQLTHYINVLRENFDFIVFAINDPDTRDDARAALLNYFLPEWQPKRALRGDRFSDAVQVKIDDQNNTPATESAGELHARITLRIVDLVSQFVIGIGEGGIFEELVA